jgi:hypothetical protein
MSFADAAEGEDVIDGLRGIEDEILETGHFVSATGDTESDLVVAFLVTDIGNGEAPYLVIDVTNAATFDEASGAWVDLSDCIDAKYLDLSGDLPKNAASVLKEAGGQQTRVNGKVIFLSKWWHPLLTVFIRWPERACAG